MMVSKKDVNYSHNQGIISIAGTDYYKDYNWIKDPTVIPHAVYCTTDPHYGAYLNTKFCPECRNTLIMPIPLTEIL